MEKLTRNTDNGLIDVNRGEVSRTLFVAHRNISAIKSQLSCVELDPERESILMNCVKSAHDNIEQAASHLGVYNIFSGPETEDETEDELEDENLAMPV